MIEKPKVGDVIEYNGQPHTVVSVQAVLTPYTKLDQYTTAIGYTLGLKKIETNDYTDWRSYVKGG